MQQAVARCPLRDALVEGDALVSYSAYHSPNLPTGVDMLASPQQMINDCQLLRCDTAADSNDSPVVLMNFRGTFNFPHLFDPDGLESRVLYAWPLPQVLVAFMAATKPPPAVVKIYEEKTKKHLGTQTKALFKTVRKGQRLHKIAGHTGTEMIEAIPATSTGFDVEFTVQSDICRKCECFLEATAKRQPVARFSYSGAPVIRSTSLWISKA